MIFFCKRNQWKKSQREFCIASCSCHDWVTWNLPCKHFFAIFYHYPKWNWNSLPGAYLSGPYLSSDHSEVTNFFQPSGEATCQIEPVTSAQTNTLPNLPKIEVRIF